MDRETEALIGHIFATRFALMELRAELLGKGVIDEQDDEKVDAIEDAATIELLDILTEMGFDGDAAKHLTERVIVSLARYHEFFRGLRRTH
ncbi:MAG: hypothetical protein WCA78_00500 [Rhizomicrobium sp.]